MNLSEYSEFFVEGEVKKRVWGRKRSADSEIT
jgi:hypothetical protein